MISFLGAGSGLGDGVTEGVLAVQHEVDGHADRPHINAVAVLLVFVDFGGHKFARP